MIKTAVILMPVLWVKGEAPENIEISASKSKSELEDLINQGCRIKMMNDFEYKGVLYSHYVLEKE